MSTTPPNREVHHDQPPPPEAATGSQAPQAMPSQADAALAAVVSLLPELKRSGSLVTAALVILALYFGRDILMPLALAFLVGFILDPLVVRLKRWGLPRVAAVVLVVGLALTVLALLGMLLTQQVSAISAELPTYRNNIQHKLNVLRASADKPSTFDGAAKIIDDVKAELEKPSAGAPRGRTQSPQRVQVVEAPPGPYQRLLAVVDAGSGPLATAGIVLVFVVLVLLDRVDLRDRLLKLWAGSLHQSTDAMDEAGSRISKYLTMQLVVNISYGVPMALGLWLIGVPGAILWGVVAAVMRFVPYLGPMISAVFPVALAFAVDPGWNMVLWTVALIAVLELISNNIIEPWLYGASTGLSAMSLMVAATFWTALWGPVGLIMSTPLTVCLLVIGRHLPRLRFLDVLLGSQPALDMPTRVYQRLLAGDNEEAIELVSDSGSNSGDLVALYDEVAIPVLCMASHDHAVVSTALHRHRVVVGMDALIDDVGEHKAGATAALSAHSAGPLEAVCLGGKWEVDTLAAKMLSQVLTRAGHPAMFRAAAPVNAEYVDKLDLRGAKVVYLSFFSPEPSVPARHICRRLRRRWPDLHIVLAFWNAPVELLADEAVQALGADAVVTSMGESVLRLERVLGVESPTGFQEAPVPANDAQRLAALRASGALDERARAVFDLAAHRAADIFDVPLAMVSLIDLDQQRVQGVFGTLPSPADQPPVELDSAALNVPRQLSICGHAVTSARTLVVADIARDPRFSTNPVLQSKGLRFYAGAPLLDDDGHALGTLCLLDVEPRQMSERDVKLLEALARDAMQALRRAAADWGHVDPALESGVAAPPSATVGQAVPE